jgi:predicted transcriptional regulator of viral defense system
VTRTITELGPREVEFLARSAERGRVLATQQATAYWGSSEYAWKVLSRLVDKGWLERLEQGSYLIIPLEAGVERVWSEDALAIGCALAPQAAGAYWTAVRHWNWTTQLPRIVTFMTPRRRHNSHPIVLGVEYRFVLVRAERVFGIDVSREGPMEVRTTDQERTIVDMMDRPDQCGGIAEVVDGLRAAWPQIEQERLLAYVERFGGGTVPKRLGFLVEHLRLELSRTDWLDEIRSRIGAGMSPLVRGGPASGPYLRRWNLRINSPGFDATDSTSS